MNVGHERIKMKSYVFRRIFQSVLKLGKKQKSIAAQLISLNFYIIFTNQAFNFIQSYYRNIRTLL
jgi:hypothetical protein